MVSPILPEDLTTATAASTEPAAYGHLLSFAAQKPALLLDAGHERGANALPLPVVADIEAVDRARGRELCEAHNGFFILRDEHAVAPETLLPEGIRVDSRRCANTSLPGRSRS